MKARESIRPKILVARAVGYRELEAGEAGSTVQA